jgi:hypothetical protein
MRTTNDAHKYLREPPTVKPFPIKYSSATHRKIGEDLIVYPVTESSRRLQAALRVNKPPTALALPFEDLLIGRTALRVGYDLLALMFGTSR